MSTPAETRPAGAGLLVSAGNRYLVQQRGLSVRHYPGCWEITAWEESR